MILSVIKIVNSNKTTLSKTIREKYKITDAFEMVLKEGSILLKPIVYPRKDWDQKFSEMHAEGEDRLLIKAVFEDETFEE